MDHNYYVYILASEKCVLYVGASNDLIRRVAQHKQRAVPGFTKKYNVNRLVYFEHTHDISAAIAREKELKNWVRAKKIALIEGMNPGWEDLYDTIVTPEAGVA